MTTTIDRARQRLKFAMGIKADLTGSRIRGGVELVEIGDYTVVDDGWNRWLILTDDYFAEVNDVVGDLLDGAADKFISDDGASADAVFAEIREWAYQEMLDYLRPCLYSKTGSPHDLDDIRDLELDPDTLRKVLEALGIDEADYAE